MYFDNFYTQVSVGTSSDTEFTLNIDGKGDIQVYVKCSDTDCTMLADQETIDKIVNYYGGNEQSTWVCYFGAGEQYNDILSQTYAINYTDLVDNHSIVPIVGNFDNRNKHSYHDFITMIKYKVFYLLNKDLTCLF